MTFFWPLDFYPRPPRGGRRFQDAVDVVPLTFLSTPSARRETSCQRGLCPPGGYFYPRPPRGGRLNRHQDDCKPEKFLSTPSARRATASTRTVASPVFYFYPRPPRGGRPCRALRPPQKRSISIHALREEGDPPEERLRLVQFSISIHALREEGDGPCRSA